MFYLDMSMTAHPTGLVIGILKWVGIDTSGGWVLVVTQPARTEGPATQDDEKSWQACCNVICRQPMHLDYLIIPMPKQTQA